MSARFTITYDGTSLQTANIISQTIQHEDVNHKRLDIQLLGRSDGGKLVSSTFGIKSIRLTGILKGSSQSDLESRLDTLKALINRQSKNLDVGYAGGTRRYSTNMSSFSMTREHYHLTYCEWEATFMVSDPPFGKGIDNSTISVTVTTANASYSGPATFTGSARPLPIIKVTINSQTSMTGLYFRNKNTGDSITLTRTFANSDVILIDTQNYTVTVNGVAADYTGFFPEFVANANDFAVKAIASAVNMTVKLIYTPAYL